MNVLDDLDQSHEEFRIKSVTAVKKLGSAIAQSIFAKKKIYLSAIGANAVNQATKAIIVASQILAAQNIDLTYKAAFYLDKNAKKENPEQVSDEYSHTVIRFFLFCRYGN